MGSVAQMSYDSDYDLRLNAPSALQQQSAVAQRARRAKWAARAASHDALVKSRLVWRFPRYWVETVPVSIAAAEQFRIAHEVIDKALYGVRVGPSVIDIKRKVAELHGITVEELSCHRREARLVRARQIAIYLVKELTQKSFPEIGRLFGNRDHTTILHSCRRIAGMIAADPKCAAEVASIRAFYAEPAE
jgi:hypothetical protein